MVTIPVVHPVHPPFSKCVKKNPVRLMEYPHLEKWDDIWDDIWVRLMDYQPLTLW